jgi:hypothetical protein
VSCFVYKRLLIFKTARDYFDLMMSHDMSWRIGGLVLNSDRGKIALYSIAHAFLIGHGLFAEERHRQQ